MSDYDYVVRDGEGQFLTVEENEVVNLTEFLEESYPYILEDMKEDDYLIEYDYFEGFKEIVIDNKVIGFFTTNTYIIDEYEILCLEEIYVIRKYRGNHCLFKSILSLYAILNKNLAIKNPSRLLIEKLIKGHLAVELSDNIIYSAIDLLDEYYNVYTDTKIAKYYDFNKLDYESYVTNFYDLNTSTILSANNQIVSPNQKDSLSISTPRKNDIDKYHINDKLKKTDKKYVKKLKKIINKNQDKINKCNEFCGYTLHMNLNVEHIIGSEDELTDFIKFYLDKNGLSLDDGYKIRDNIIEAMDHNQIDELSIPTRLAYILDHPDTSNLVDESKKKNEDKCPFCDNDIEKKWDYCERCGLLLDYDKNPSDFFKTDEQTINEDTGLEVDFEEKIINEGYIPSEVYELQFDIAVYQFLNTIDVNPAYPTLPSYSQMHHIRDGDIEEFLENNDYVKKRVNPNYNPDNQGDVELLNSKLHDSNEIDEYIYKITKKGRRFYKKNKIAKAFDAKVSKFDYYKFYYYCKKNDKLKADENAENFYKIKLDEAISNDDEELYTKILENNYSNALDNNEDVESVGIKLLKAIIASVNTHKLNNKTDDIKIDVSMAMNYMFFKNFIYHDDIDSLYDRAFDSIKLDKLKINKEKIRLHIKKLEDDNDSDDDLINSNLEVLDR